MEQIRISVRDLVEFILRSGDLDNRRGGISDTKAMQMGSRLHRKIQNQMGSDYHAEVPLKIEIDCGEYQLSIEGRADGILTKDSIALIDEIKGVYTDLRKIEEPVPVHLAQAKCYAYIYATQHHLQEIQVQMTYVHLESENVKRIEKIYTQDELEEWFFGIVKEYRKWTDFQVEWRKIRQASILQTVFPFPYREGQKELAAAVYRTIQREKKLFIQAPTGVGKTLSTVFPAVQAVGQGFGDKIFYLTAKTITRTVAQEAFSLLKEKNLKYKVITLTAKEKICMCEETDCNPEKCPYAKGHFDRVNDAVFELLTSERENGNYTREVLEAQAEKWKVCPFEMGLDLSLWVDAVICDYNYVFDPQAKLKRFFSEGIKGEYIFLIDEAHNLVERGRDMYSAVIYKEDLLEGKRLVKEYSSRVSRALERCNKQMLEWKRECEGYELLKNADTFQISLLNASTAFQSMLEDRDNPFYSAARGKEEAEGRKKILELYFSIQSFLEIYEEVDDSYEIYTELEENGRFKVKLYCIQTARKIGQCLEKGRGTILFSATLLPVRYYMELLSGTEEDYAVYAKSTFDPAKKKILLARDVSSKYTRRGPREYEKIAAYIQNMIQARPGKYLVFFPSYKMMEDVQAVYEELSDPEQVTVIAQSSQMTENMREEFLQKFEVEHDEETSLIGFCVMGGIFGEGIDLKRENLIGAVLVGTGLPQICNEREILKNYYNRRNMDGFAHAYRYPGMNKVMQSAGRVIRTEEDCGVILLLDERFQDWEYRSMFPREWADYEVCSLKNVQEKLEKFWKKHACDPSEAQLSEGDTF